MAQPAVTNGHTAKGRVLIVNSYSTLNRGDAAILDGLIATLRAAGAKHIAVAAPTGEGEADRRMALGADEVVPMVIDVRQAPDWLGKAYPLLGVWVLWRLAWVSVMALVQPRSMAALRAYCRADLIVSSGGAYLGGERPGMNILTGYQILVARLTQRPCLVAPQTVNPMSSIVAYILSRMLANVTVYTRDVPSARRLLRIGIHAKRGADLAFRSPHAKRAPGRSTPTQGLVTVGCAPRDFWSGTHAHRSKRRIERAATDALSRLVRQDGARVVLITQSNAFGVEDDSSVVQRLVTHLPADVRRRTEILDAPTDIEAAVGQYAAVDFVYAFRLHAAILALLAGTPVMAVGYDPKVAGVLDLLGLQDWVLDISEASHAETVYSRLIGLRGVDAGSRARDAMRIADEMSTQLEADLRRRLHVQ